MVHKLTACQKRVLKHLEKDQETWVRLSEKAKEEAMSDLKLIRRIRGMV